MESSVATTMRSALAFLCASGLGLLLWTMTAFAGGQREPWDTMLYWSVSYPAALVFAALLGVVWPHRAWRQAAVLIGSQLIVMLANGAGFSLLPLGLVVLAVLSLPAMLFAELGAALGRRAQA